MTVPQANLPATTTLGVRDGNYALPPGRVPVSQQAFAALGLMAKRGH